MKKIINGKLYNTDTAELIGSDDNGLGYGDFRYQREELYRKKTGEFFLYGEGGAMSAYRERCGDMWGGGSAINPITTDEAKQWAEQHLSADEYISIFGEVAE